jgi:hypothetical protein
MKRLLKATAAAFVVIALSGVCLVGASPEAKAGLYTLNLLFDDGGTGTGLIDIDGYGYPGDNPPSSASTTAGSTLGSATYDANVIAPYYNASVNPYLLVFPTDGYERELSLLFEYPLNGTHSPNPVVVGSMSFECFSWSCPGPSGAGGDTRYIVAGSFATVAAPEPASLAILGASLASIGLVRRRQRAVGS